jgi:hypothetical protein
MADAEREHGEQAEEKKPVENKKRTHHTHFPVLKKRLRKTDYDTGFEWVPSGTGRSKLVPKKPQK